MTGAPRPRRVRLRALGGPALSLASLLLVWAAAEALCATLLSRPHLLRRAPAGVARLLRHYYLAHDRELLQANPAFSRFDAELLYTLRPGRFRFSNREFDTAFSVNSLGLRDDEQALRAPELIVAGDSFAMGWGVEAHETFAARLAARTGLRVLNAGVSSYGTARELLLLRRVDTSALRVLVIQYDRNDAWENVALERHGGRLPPRPRERYERTLVGSRRERRYWPGSHTLTLLRGALRRVQVEHEPIPSAAEQARLFAFALRTLLPGLGPGGEPGRYVLFVCELSPAAPPDDAFARALRAELARPGAPDWLRRVHVVELGAALRREHYYDLDDHLRPAGHQAVADELARALVRAGGW